MPISAMPEHLNSKEEIEAAFPDDSQYGDDWFGRSHKWYQKATKTWFAFSYRCPEWWAKVRKYPKVLFAIGGQGKWRFEGEGFEEIHYNLIQTGETRYLSRVQYYKRWHFAIQLVVWDKMPLVFPMVSFHWYPKAEDVPEYFPYKAPRGKDLKGKVWFGYWNHFDADLVHWLLTSAFFGDTWK